MKGMITGMVYDLEIGESRIELIEGDITAQNSDAIVNAANSSLMGGGGVDGAIHRAGGPAILEECKKIITRIGRLETGKAVITTGGNLSARYVIHTVGPVWSGGTKGEAEKLASCYSECLKLASAHKLASISFPSISTGAYRYPLTDAAQIALRTVIAFLGGNNTPVKYVAFVLYGVNAFDTYAAELSKLKEPE